MQGAKERTIGGQSEGLDKTSCLGNPTTERDRLVELLKIDS